MKKFPVVYSESKLTQSPGQIYLHSQDHRNSPFTFDETSASIASWIHRRLSNEGGLWNTQARTYGL